MKRILWSCVIVNLIYCLAEFTNIITPAYIIILLLLLILINSGNIKSANRLALLVAIVGIILSIFGLGNLIIIACGIAIIMEFVHEIIIVNNQQKYNESMGNDSLEKKDKKEDIQRVSKYDIDIIKGNFDNYILNYDKTNYMINEKYEHTLNVAINSLDIAKSIGLDEEGTYLAYVIGILHDIGRFEQVREYHTLDDKNSIDHADFGYSLLKDGLIRQFLQDNKYDNIVLKTVKNHNKMIIDNSYSEDEKLYCSIIRDADKLDIFKRLSEGDFSDDYNLSKEMEISSDIINQINEKHIIDSNLINNKLEEVVLRLAMAYDINYKYTLEVMEKNDYLNKYITLIDKLDILDINKITFRKIVNDINTSIHKKL